MTETTALISSMATKQILRELIAAYAKNTGNPVHLESVGGVDAAKRIRAGETFDVALLASDAIDALTSAGFIDRGTVRNFARSSTAVAVRAGVPRPAACDEASVKQLLTDARSIALSTGPSGTSIVKMLQGWSLYEATKDRIVQAPPGVPVAQLLESGRADVGFQQLSELLNSSGIEIVGALPDTLQPMTLFALGIIHTAQNLQGASSLIEYLLSVESKAAKIRNGMEPA